MSSSSRRRGFSTTSGGGAAAAAAAATTGLASGPSDVADAVLDENVLHAMQKSSIVNATDVVCLSPDARVGPLTPGACHVVDLQFLALKAGLVGIEAIRVVDLTTQEHVDIRDLPTTMVEPALT